jgi:ABC-type multidrug transport system fused ATPase/permease subunit
VNNKLGYREIFLFNSVRPLLFFVFIALLASAYLGQLLPKIVFELSRNYELGDVFIESLWDLFYLLIIIFWIRFAFQLALNRYVMKLIDNIRNLCYENWLNSFDFNRTDSGIKVEEEFPLGEVIARIMSDTQSIRDLLTSGALTIIFNVIFVASCAYGFIQIDSFLGAVVVVAEVGFSVALIYGSKYMRKIFIEVRRARSEVSRQIANVSGGTSDAYFFGHHKYAQLSGNKTYSSFMTKQLNSNVWDASYYSVAESLYPILLAMVIFFAPMSNILEGAMVFALVDLIQRSIDPIKNIAGKISVIQRALTGVVRVQSFHAHLKNRISSDSIQHLGAEKLRSIDVTIPSYSYPIRKEENEQDLRFELKNINFSANSGQLIGIVGTSGCGKSTLLKILSGNILPNIGGVTVKFSQAEDHFYPGEEGSGLALYRELTSIISQDSHVFSETLRFNITMGIENQKNRDVDEFWAWVSSELPYLQKWAIKLDDEVDVGAISAGQKQLISALRACYLHKGLVFFDEISSALDSDLEEALRKIVMIIQKQSLTFIVAHRIETVIHSNLILVMKDGEIVSRGRHETLLKESEHYKDFISKLN